MNMGIVLVTELHLLPNFPSPSISVPLVFQDPVEDPPTHLEVISP